MGRHHDTIHAVHATDTVGHAVPASSATGPANGPGDARGRARPRWRRAVAAIGLGALAVAACGADDDSSARDSDDAEIEEAVDAARPGDFDGAGGEAIDDDAAAEVAASVPALEEAGDGAADTSGEPATGGSAPILPDGDFGRDVITEVGLVMATPDVATTADDVRRLALDNGGAVFRSDVTIGDVQDDGSVPGGGTMTIRIPPPDLNRLVEALEGLGTVAQITQDAEDVTDRLVDVEIRIRQARTGIERIETLLETAVELDDVFDIETELNRRQVDLERLLAAQRSTEDRVALATLDIVIEYRAPDAIPDPANVGDGDGDDGDGIGDAFADGWNAFVGMVFAVAFVLAITAPFLAIALIVAGLAWLVTRRLRRDPAGRRAGSTAAGTASADTSSAGPTSTDPASTHPVDGAATAVDEREPVSVGDASSRQD